MSTVNVSCAANAFKTHQRKRIERGIRDLVLSRFWAQTAIGLILRFIIKRSIYTIQSHMLTAQRALNEY